MKNTSKEKNNMKLQQENVYKVFDKAGFDLYIIDTGNNLRIEFSHNKYNDKNPKWSDIFRLLDIKRFDTNKIHRFDYDEDGNNIYRICITKNINPSNRIIDNVLMEN